MRDAVAGRVAFGEHELVCRLVPDGEEADEAFVKDLERRKERAEKFELPFARAACSTAPRVGHPLEHCARASGLSRSPLEHDVARDATRFYAARTKHPFVIGDSCSSSDW